MHGYLDGELDLIGSLNFEQHVQDCQSCARIFQNHQALRTSINTGSLYFNAPAKFQKRVRLVLREASSDEPRARLVAWQWLGVAASLALIAIIVWNFATIQRSPAVDDLVAQEIVSGHVRSLMANHLMDVPSSDQHTVKPWFDGKLDFAPPVANPAEQGFTLIGGRLDYIGSRSVAALVYQRHQHFINVFIWPSTTGTDVVEKTLTKQGYNLIHWNKSGMTFWAISDLNSSELQEFVRASQNPA
jgi:anti-sigma factor RsiW